MTHDTYPGKSVNNLTYFGNKPVRYLLVSEDKVCNPCLSASTSKSEMSDFVASHVNAVTRSAKRGRRSYGLATPFGLPR